MGKIIEISVCGNCGKQIDFEAIVCPACEDRDPEIKWIQFLDINE